MENNVKYTLHEKKLDQYLGTNNLRPGPPRKLIYKMDEIELNQNFQSKNNQKNNKNLEKDKKKINYFSYSREIKKDINWDELLAVKKSSTGSGGVYFLEFLQSTSLVLKSSVDIPSLYFGSILKKACGIDTPSFRIIEYEDPEFSSIITSMEKVSVQDHRIYNEVKNSLAESVFLIIYEYVPNLSLIELGPNRSQIFFKDTHSQSRKIFIQLGRIIAFDVLTNNFDRLPFVWNNIGNVDNFLFKINLDLLTPNANFKDMTFLDIYIDSVVAIDTKPICLNPQDRVALKNLGDYLNRLSETLKLFFYEMKNIMLIGKNVETFEFRSMTKIQTLFKDSCNYILKGINLFHLGEGFILMMNDIIDIDLNEINTVIDIVKNKTIKRDWGDVYKNNSKLLNIEYFKYILNFLKQTKEENEDIFNWVQDTTMGLYSCEFKKNLKEILDFQQKMRFDYQQENVSPLDEKKVDKIKTEENKEDEPDFLNYKKEDKIKIKNDVHNGVFEIMPLDEDMVLDRRKKEFIKLEVKKPQVISIRPKKTEVIDNTTIDPHKKYTMEELKEKIKKDELKDTLNVKKKYNPKEAKYLEEKIIASGNEDLLKDDDKENEKENKKSSSIKSPTKKSRKKTKNNTEEEEEEIKSIKKSKTVKNPNKRKLKSDQDDDDDEEEEKEIKTLKKKKTNINETNQSKEEIKSKNKKGKVKSGQSGNSEEEASNRKGSNSFFGKK